MNRKILVRYNVLTSEGVLPVTNTTVIEMDTEYHNQLTYAEFERLANMVNDGVEVKDDRGVVVKSQVVVLGFDIFADGSLFYSPGNETAMAVDETAVSGAGWLDDDDD